MRASAGQNDPCQNRERQDKVVSGIDRYQKTLNAIISAGERRRNRLKRAVFHKGLSDHRKTPQYRFMPILTPDWVEEIFFWQNGVTFEACNL
jgi:hypothetical protein